MTQTDPVTRLLGYVIGPPIEFIGRRVERRVQRAMLDLPEPPWWAVPVTVAVAVAGTVAAQLGEGRGEPDPDPRRERERAEPEPEATAERGTTSASDDTEPVKDALETLEVAPPPVPEQDEVRAAYRRRALEAHPDQGGDAQEFIEVREAWEVVSERKQLSGGQNDDGGN